MIDQRPARNWSVGRHWGKSLGTLAVLAGLLVLLRVGPKVSLLEIFEAVGRFDRLQLGLAFSAVLVQIGCQSGRLWALFPASGNLGFLPVARIFCVGQLVNSFAPARAGEVVKVVGTVKASASRLSGPDAAGALVADKFLDLLALAFLISLAGAEWAADLRPPGGFALTAGLAFLSLLAGLLFLLYRRFRPVLAQIIGRFLCGLSALWDPRRLVPALLLAIACWAAELFAIQSLCRGLGFPLGFSQGLWVLVVLNLGIAIPVSVANLGAFEASMAFGLARFRVPAALGTAVGLVHHAFQLFGLLTWIGVLFLAGAFRGKPVMLVPLSTESVS